MKEKQPRTHGEQLQLLRINDVTVRSEKKLESIITVYFETETGELSIDFRAWGRYMKRQEGLELKHRLGADYRRVRKAAEERYAHIFGREPVKKLPWMKRRTGNVESKIKKQSIKERNVKKEVVPHTAVQAVMVEHGNAGSEVHMPVEYRGKVFTVVLVRTQDGDLIRPEWNTGTVSWGLIRNLKRIARHALVEDARQKI